MATKKAVRAKTTKLTDGDIDMLLTGMAAVAWGASRGAGDKLASAELERATSLVKKLTSMRRGESDTACGTTAVECAKERGGCGRRFPTFEDFAEHECALNATPAKSMAVTQGLKIKGTVAACLCGHWSCETNEVAEADIRKTLESNYALHAEGRQEGHSGL